MSVWRIQKIAPSLSERLKLKTTTSADKQVPMKLLTAAFERAGINVEVRDEGSRVIFLSKNNTEWTDGTPLAEVVEDASSSSWRV